MAVEHSNLIENALASEPGIVTYRLLSRLAHIHVNSAKRILFGYHRDANSRKPGSITATYVLSGLRKVPPKPIEVPTVNIQDDENEDVPMQSSPLDSIMRSSPPLAVENGEDGQNEEEGEEEELEAVVLLVGEENVQETVESFKAITAYHVYSIQAKAPESLKTLGAIEHMMRAQFPPKEMKLGGKEFGAIVCEGVEFQGKKPPPSAMPSAKAKVTPAVKPASKPAPEPKKASPTEEKKPSAFFKPSAKSTPNSTSTPIIEKKESKSTVPAKRTQADFFKRTPSSASKSAPPKKQVKVEPKLESDEEEEEEEVEEPKVERDFVKEEALRKKKKEDEDALKAMMEMDDDDIEMEDTPAEAPRSPDWEEPAEEEQEEEQEEESKPLDVQKEEEAKEEEPKEIATETSGGRRRGRRKVKKARTVRDEKGYLETRFEEVWESFSEDEPEPVKKKEAIKKAPVKKAPAGKKGQGSIMSFFGKK